MPESDAGQGFLQPQLRVGAGRVAVLGDAMLLTAPELIETPAEAERAARNPQFTMNLFYWLSELLFLPKTISGPNARAMTSIAGHKPVNLDAESLSGEPADTWEIGR